MIKARFVRQERVLLTGGVAYAHFQVTSSDNEQKETRGSNAIIAKLVKFFSLLLPMLISLFSI